MLSILCKSEHTFSSEGSQIIPLKGPKVSKKNKESKGILRSFPEIQTIVSRNRCLWLVLEKRKAQILKVLKWTLAVETTHALNFSYLLWILFLELCLSSDVFTMLWPQTYSGPCLMNCPVTHSCAVFLTWAKIDLVALSRFIFCLCTQSSLSR